MAIPSPIVRNLEQGGIVRTMAIDLSDRPEDRAAVIEVLRSKLYANKILAPIREYSTNAMDAHVEAGIPDSPIRITLPSVVSPEFRVRDFGAGLSPDEVEAIYIKYGRSTKRNTNAQTGQLGLGCKSAFAYGDNFVVVAYKDGVKTMYNLTINGICTILSSEPTDEPSGMEIVVPVSMSDIQQFQKEALDFFLYWKVAPIIVGGDADCYDRLKSKDTSVPIFAGENWEIRPGSDYYSRNDSRVIMGNIPYPIDFNIVASKLNLSSRSKDEIVFEFVRSNKTLLWFGVGELDFSASRESLEYTEKTVKAVVSTVKEITESIFDILCQKIADAKTYWEALLIYNKIFGRNDEKLFVGDLARLEGVYRGKINWNGISITYGGFTELDKWDVNLGHFSDGKWSDVNGAPTSDSRTSILTTYTRNHNDRLRKHFPSDYSYREIMASNKSVIIINDSEKPIAADTVARWAMFRNSNAIPCKVYHLKFRDAKQEKEFFAKTHFESAPYIRTSGVYLEIKTWAKAQRAVSSVGSASTGGVRLPIRCFTPATRKNKHGYYTEVRFGRVEVDIYETEGFYIKIEGEEPLINKINRVDLCNLSHHTYVLFQLLGKSVERVYAFPRKNYEAKWFADAVEDEQWIQLEDYFKSKVKEIIGSNSAAIAKAMAYYMAADGNGAINAAFAKKILPFLDNQNGVMYKICLELSDDFQKHKELIDAFEFFGITLGEEYTGSDFKHSADKIKKAYPLLKYLENNRFIFYGDDTMNNDYLERVATYINMVDEKDNP